jgi:hypothetical protein
MSNHHAACQEAAGYPMLQRPIGWARERAAETGPERGRMLREGMMIRVASGRRPE